MNERSSSFCPTGGAVVDGLHTHLDTRTIHETVWHQFLQILICASCTLGQGDFTLICATSTTSPAPRSQPCVTFTVLWESGKNPSGFASHCLSVLSWKDWCVLHKPANKRNMRAGPSVAHKPPGVTRSIMDRFLLKITTIKAHVKILIQELQWCRIIDFIHSSLFQGSSRATA